MQARTESVGTVQKEKDLKTKKALGEVAGKSSKIMDIFRFLAGSWNIALVANMCVMIMSHFK